MNSVTGTFGCLYMQPVILSFLWGSIISRKLHSIFLSLYSFRTFDVLYFNLLSIYIKVPTFEAGVGLSSFTSIFDKTVLFVLSLQSVIPSTLGLFRKFYTRYFRSSKWYGNEEIFIWRYKLKVRRIDQSHQCFEIFEWLELSTCVLYHIVISLNSNSNLSIC